jgi:CubicO group peptidase (beta-lactamase class C family)
VKAGASGRRAAASALLLAAGWAGAASAQSVDEVIAVHADSATFTGVVLIRDGNGAETFRAVGSAVREFAVPHRRDTRFKWHSLTKPITSVAVHAAAARGQLDLAAPVCRYLDPCPATWQQLRVRHLLNHSSGIPELENEWFSGWEGDLATTWRAIAERRTDLAPTTVPGSAFRYSNGGYVLLASILEVGTGASFHDAVAALVFQPAEMTDAGIEHGPDRSVTPWYAGPVLVPRLAAGYNGSPAELRTAYSLMYTIPGAGAAYGTADDLVRFARAVFQNHMLPEAAMRAMVTPDTAIHPRYADGWVVRDEGGIVSYSHTGGTNGFLASLTHYPARDLTIVILSNLGFTDMRGLAAEVADAALGAIPEAERRSRPTEPAKR